MTLTSAGARAPAAEIPPILTVKDLARLLKVSESQVKRMNLPGVEVGKGRWRYVTSQVLEHMARLAERGESIVRRTA